MASIASEEEICDQFQSFGVVVRNPDVIDKMREISIVYKVAAGDLAEHWFAFCTSHSLDSEPTVQSLTKLENEEFNSKKRIKSQSKLGGSDRRSSTANYNSLFQDELSIIDDSDEYLLLEAYGTPDVCAAKKRQRTPNSATPAKRLNNSVDGTGTPSIRRSTPLTVPNSPLSSSQSPNSIMTSTPSAKYANRSNAGDISIVFGGLQLSDVDWCGQTNMAEDSTLDITIKPYVDDESVVTERYKYMYLKLRLISTILDERIDEMATVFQEIDDIHDVFSVAHQTADEVTVVGRVLCDGNGRLNASSVTLSGSVETSNGRQVQLDLSNLPEYSIFPGQIVACSGRNSTGHRFVAYKLLPNVPVPSLPKTSPSFPADFLSFMVAAGPYMTSDSISYDPLHDFLKTVAEQKPHVCILIGPFVDAKQKQIEDANFHETYDDIFSRCMELILKFSRRSSTQFVIVPSTRDVHHDFVYPTPPFSSKSYSKEKNLKFVSDPSLLNISGVVVGLTAADVLMHLGREEISFPSLPDRLGRLASHLLLQRSFYPIYPSSDEMNIDYEKLETVGRLPVTPHVLILPSDLNAFVKNIQGCCCINPQRLTRGTCGGTYARFRIQSAPSAASSDSSSIVSQLACQIVRI